MLPPITGIVKRINPNGFDRSAPTSAAFAPQRRTKTGQ
jgi:hypothetical protein